MSELNPKIKELILSYEKVNIELAFALVEESGLKGLCDFCRKLYDDLFAEKLELRNLIKLIRVELYGTARVDSSSSIFTQLSRLLRYVRELMEESRHKWFAVNKYAHSLACDLEFHNYKKPNYAN